MVMFPDSVVCILQDNYTNTLTSKMHLGKRNRLLNTEIDVTFAFRNYEAVQAMYLFYTELINNTQDEFLINIPIFGFEDKYVVRLDSPMSWTSIAGATGQMDAKLRVVEHLRGLNAADFEIDINVLEDEKDTEYDIYAEASSSTTATIYVFGDVGYKKIDNIDENGQTITIKGNNKVYGININRFRIFDNSVVENVFVHKNEKQTNAYRMFMSNGELTYIGANPYTFGNVKDFSWFATYANKLSNIDTFDTSKGVVFNYFLMECYELREIPYFDVSGGESFYYFARSLRKLEKVAPLNFASAITTESALYDIGLDTVNGTLLQGTISLPECTNIDSMLRYSKIQNDIKVVAPKVTNAQYAFAQTTFKKVEVAFNKSVDCKEAFWRSHFDALKIVANKAFDNVYYMFEDIEISCIKGKLWTDEDTDGKEYMFGNADSITTPDQDAKDALMSDDGSIWENDTCS